MISDWYEPYDWDRLEGTTPTNLRVGDTLLLMKSSGQHKEVELIRIRPLLRDEVPARFLTYYSSINAEADLWYELSMLELGWSLIEPVPCNVCVPRLKQKKVTHDFLWGLGL